MPYRPIAHGAAGLPHVLNAIHRLESYYLEPVHTILRLPMPHRRLTANYHFLLAQTLLTAIAGTSTTLFREGGNDRARFEGVVTKFYPWGEEPTNQVTPKDGAKILYELFRCPFVHDLGINLNARTHTVVAKVLRVIRVGRGMTWKDIRLLERRQRRLMNPTVINRPDGTVVMQIEPLYWGTRTLLERLTHERPIMEKAEAYLVRYAHAI